MAATPSEYAFQGWKRPPESPTTLTVTWRASCPTRHCLRGSTRRIVSQPQAGGGGSGKARRIAGRKGPLPQQPDQPDSDDFAPLLQTSRPDRQGGKVTARPGRNADEEDPAEASPTNCAQRAVPRCPRCSTCSTRSSEGKRTTTGPGRPRSPSSRWTATCGSSFTSGLAAGTPGRAGNGSPPATSARTTRTGATGGSSATGKPGPTSTSTPGRRSSGTRRSPAGTRPTILPSPSTGPTGGGTETPATGPVLADRPAGPGRAVPAMQGTAAVHRPHSRLPQPVGDLVRGRPQGDDPPGHHRRPAGRNTASYTPTVPAVTQTAHPTRTDRGPADACRPRGLLEPCAATSGTHGSEEGGAENSTPYPSIGSVPQARQPAPARRRHSRRSAARRHPIHAQPRIHRQAWTSRASHQGAPHFRPGNAAACRRDRQRGAAANSPSPGRNACI